MDRFGSIQYDPGMDPGQLATLLSEGQDRQAAELIAQYTFPVVTTLREDFSVHDLAVVEIVSGSFTPAGARVMIDVDAAFSLLGWARAALLLYVGQPVTADERLYDSGGKPVEGATCYSVASLNGEAAWAETTHRRLVLDVDPRRPVTWQLLPAIIGSSATVPVTAPRLITITPDGTKAFVTSPTTGFVTPILLGRPGYSYDHRLKALDVECVPVPIRGAPTYLSSDDAHVVISNVDATEGHVSVLSVPSHELVLQTTIPGGVPLGSAISPDGRHALVGSGSGCLARIDLTTGEVETVDLAGRIVAVAVAPDGKTAYAADAEGRILYQLSLPDLKVEAKIDLGRAPHVVRFAPDGQLWVLCRPVAPEAGRLVQVDPAESRIVNDYELPFAEPNDVAIVPTQGQSSRTVRTAWIVYEGGRYSELYIGGAFTGEVHSHHHGSLGEDLDLASSVAVNDFGEIWVTQPDLDQVWKWPGGRLSCRADAARAQNGAFFGEYCEVAVYGAVSHGG